MQRALHILETVYGYDSFRPGQREVLEAVFAGEDVMAVMPTGSGKSLLYQLPALVRPGLTIVVSPLIALMRDQVQALRAYKIAAAALNSANEYAENMRVEDAIREGKLRLVYVAPERLVREDTLALLRDARANLLAIDEAHCVSQWGHDFRPEYLALGDIARALGDIQTLAVTATADEPTRKEISRKLFVRPPHIFVHSFDRPNLRLAMTAKKNSARQIADALEAHKGSNGIVYCSSRKRCERFAEALCALGHDALPYHAGLAPLTRSANQDRFLREDGIVVCATIAFGMGIDKPDVRFVFHADLPQSVEAYYQEIGRAGRDGLPADTLLLFGAGDVGLRKRQIFESDAPQERKRVDYIGSKCWSPCAKRRAADAWRCSPHLAKRRSPAAIATIASARCASSTAWWRRRKSCRLCCARPGGFSLGISPIFWLAGRPRRLKSMAMTSCPLSASGATAASRNGARYSARFPRSD